MDKDMLQPLAKPIPKPSPLTTPLKHALYAWRSAAPFDDMGKPFRGIRYSSDTGAKAGWIRIGPVGSLFAAGTKLNDGTVNTLPLVQFARSVTVGTAYTLELAPVVDGTAEFESWLARRSSTFGATGETLGYALSPLDPVVDQLTLPLLSAEVRGDDALPLNQPVTTDVGVWNNLIAGASTPFSLLNPALGGSAPIAQIPPIFEVEVDFIAGVIVPTVRVGQTGKDPGDLVVPPGVGAMIRFFRRTGADFKLDGATFSLAGSPAPDFEVLVDSEDQVLVEDRAIPESYDYTLSVTTSLGSSASLDPKLKNRASADGP